jgi:hypothetical protein
VVRVPRCFPLRTLCRNFLDVRSLENVLPSRLYGHFLTIVTVAIAYPEPWNKGRALGYWLSYKLIGQILGGAINLGLNADRNEAGKVTYTVYLIFIAIQCSGPLIGLLLDQPHQVQRRDGKQVNLTISKDPWYEIRATTKLFFTRNFLLILLWIGQAVFAEAVIFTYLACKFKESI